MSDDPGPTGYCHLEIAPGEFEAVLMADLRPGDVFVFIEEGPLLTLVMDESNPFEQRVALWRGLLKRGRRLRYVERNEPSGLGGERCAAEPIGE